MGEDKVYHLAGFTGLIACLITLAKLPLGFTGGIGVPALSSVGAKTGTLYITQILMDMVILLCLLFFVTAFRKMVLEKRQDMEWLISLFFALSLVYITSTIMADSISGSITLAFYNNKGDPAVLKALMGATTSVFGCVGLLLVGSMMILAGVLIRYSNSVPDWIGWFSFLAAVVNYAFVPAMYSGTTEARFYSPAGTGPVLATSLFLLWILFVSIFMIKRQTKPIGF